MDQETPKRGMERNLFVNRYQTITLSSAATASEEAR
jgi:hypothetical protein